MVTSTSEHTPSPQSLTLRMKNHKTTILLLVQPTQSFQSIKTQLLSALSVAKITSINDHPIPSSISNIEIGVPRNLNDLTEGFVPLQVGGGNVKGKRNPRPKAPKVMDSGSVLNETPVGAGLKDGQALAFRFVSGQKREGKQKVVADSEGDDEDQSMDVDPEQEQAQVDEEWDVVVPTFEYEGED